MVSGAGIYSDTLSAWLCCDSVIHTTIDATPVISMLVVGSVRSGGSFTTGGGQVVSVAGVYSDTLSSWLSCDSVIQTTINVNPVIFTQASATICSNETFTTGGGQVISAAVVYSDTLVSMMACDSFILTTININPVIFT